MSRVVVLRVVIYGCVGVIFASGLRRKRSKLLLPRIAGTTSLDPLV